MVAEIIIFPDVTAWHITIPFVESHVMKVSLNLVQFTKYITMAVTNYLNEDITVTLQCLLCVQLHSLSFLFESSLHINNYGLALIV